MEVISANAGWLQASWWPRSNSDVFKDINRFPSFSENWKLCVHLGRRLPNAGRRRKVVYARAATFHGTPGISTRFTNQFNAIALDANGNAYLAGVPTVSVM